MRARLLNWSGRGSWLLLLRHEFALFLQLKVCAPCIGHLEVLDDALTALIGVRGSRTRGGRASARAYTEGTWHSNQTHQGRFDLSSACVGPQP